MLFFREHNWPMEAFAHTNRKTPVFVAEKTSQAGERESYDKLLPEWNALKSHTLPQMKEFLRQNVPESRLMLHGLTKDDLLDN